MRAKIEVASTPGRARRFFWTAMVMVLLAASVESVIGRRVDRSRGRPAGDGFGLFATPRLVLASNRLQCTITNSGEECAPSDLGIGGAFPTGTADNYIYNSGFQVAGIASDEAGPWAGDTVGAYLMDTTGQQQHGTPLEQIYDSLNPDDLENWPEEAVIDDVDLFSPILIGRKTASQQDTWTRYWDGDPSRTAQRPHPMGFAVTQRTMSWNYPSGNESVIYFLMEFENVTNDPDFQRPNELKFFGGDDALPDAGWAYDEVFVSLTTDNDVSNAFENYATAILPFDLGISYHGGFSVPSGFGWEFPPDVFFPPFFVEAPGIVGFKYLRSPLNPQTEEEVGLTMFSVFGWPDSPFFDPQGGVQLWRYLSGRMDLSAGDPPCSVTAEIQTLSPSTTVRSVCNIELGAKDIRFFQSSGPFVIGAGEASSVVVAYVIAPTVETMPDGSPSGIVASSTNKNSNPPGFPSFHPGFPSARGCDTGGQNCTEILRADENEVKTIERGAGWVSYDGPPPAGGIYPPGVEHPSNSIEESAVRVVPGSLLGRALVAQSVFDNKFLLGFPPDPPAFYLVPGNNTVTVIWEPSASETGGDPFYALASDPESALYNPNYRQFDVEGYRIWRGTQKGQLDLIEQFDYADTRFADYTCETVLPDEDVGATDPDGEPVLGFAGGDTCPLDSDNFLVHQINGSLIFNNGSAGGAPGAGVSREPVALALDTAVVSDRDVGQVQPLRDNGVSFTYIDGTVTNNFTYFYAVTAFDVNSQASGPLSLRSVRVSQSVVPRSENSALQAGFEADVIMTGDDGVPLDMTQSNIAPDVDTGIFPGPQPPTSSIELLINPPPAEVASLLASGQLTGVFDSVTAEDISFGCADTGGNSLGACLVIHMTFDNGIETGSTSLEIARGVWDSFGDPPTVTGPLGAGLYPYDDEALASFDIPAGAGVGVAAGLAGSFDMTISDPSFLGQRVRRFADGWYQPGGNRWFDGTEEVTPDPTTFIRAGHIDGVDSVWAPIHHTERSSADLTTYPASGQMQCWGYTLAILSRAADYQVTWGAGGTVTVRDITHNVPVDFKESPQMSYGFMNTDGNGNGVIDWQDFDYLDVIRQASSTTNTFCSIAANGVTPTRSVLEPSATPQPVSLDGVDPNNVDAPPMTTAGNGFGLYINGERYIFLTSSLPAEGTVWTYRTYNGRIRAQDALTDDPSGYELREGSGSNRSPAIPNMVFTMDVKEAGVSQVKPFDLAEVHTVPDPYLSTSQYDLSPTTKQLMFVNLPPMATIRIYTLTGILVDIVNHNDASGGGREVWDLRSRNNQFVASGVYFFHVVDADGAEHVGKFTVVTSAQ